MTKFCVFAGTTEGRQMVEFLCTQPVKVLACVATEYGEALLEPAENLQISAGRLDRAQMEQLFARERFDLVIDATHPYAREVTENLVGACAAARTAYLRLLRERSGETGEAVYVRDVSEAVSRLDETEGPILLTTGSKELAAFSALRNFSDRVYARVLPMEASLKLCAEAGVKTSHILAMQGPFSEEMNTAMLRAVGAKYLVTKESGAAGGFDEKIAAARQAGATAVVIGRPPQQEGMTFAETVRWLCDRFQLKRCPHVTVAGIGPGGREGMTEQVLGAIRRSDCLIGAARMLEAVSGTGIPAHAEIAPANIAAFIREHPQYQKLTVLLSGDVGFFSGAKKLLPLLGDCDVEVCPGLSSLVCLCARLETSYEDVVPVSLHGRDHNPCADLRRHRRIFVLVGGENGLGRLCRTLCDGGFSDAKVSAAERLGYPQERITVGSAAELAGMEFDRLAVALVERTGAGSVVTHGLSDGAFQRGGSETGVIPMTKREVRSVALSDLELRSDSVCWDVGAGTGSVAVEMALQAPEGRVYAIEKKEEALALLAENRRKFGLENLEIVAGTAPQACEDLPAPTHVFLGGTGGNLEEILALLRRKNPDVRIVAAAITLETVAELTRLSREFASAEVCSMTVAKDRKAGPYRLMTGQNPIYLFTMQGGKTK